MSRAARRVNGFYGSEAKKKKNCVNVAPRPRFKRRTWGTLRVGLMWACESFLVRSKAVWKIWDSSSRPLAEGVQVGEQPGGAAAEGVPGAEQGSGDIAA